MRITLRVLVFNKFYLPGYKAGGPIRTLANMAERMGDDFDFRIITQDRDAGERHPYCNINESSWYEVGKAKVSYMNPASLSVGRLIKLVYEVNPDIIYLNSFFDKIFTQRILWGRRFGYLRNIPIILAPRGEFSPGAIALKHGKKELYIHFSRLFGLYRNLIWQASSSYELG
jgi:hypothetical protein